MQPYLFPYLGYFQLIHAVDKFVVYDDVSFIKQGWINRNNLLLNGRAHMFSVPIAHMSSYSLISETQIAKNDLWKSKFLKTLRQAYERAPYFQSCFEIIQRVIQSAENSIAALAVNGIKEVCDYCSIKTAIRETSVDYRNAQLKSQSRVIDICVKEQATEYVNLSGGVSIYTKEAFDEHHIQLRFIRMKNVEYAQFGNGFIPSLSIIDVMMFNSKEQITELLKQFELT